MFSREVIERRIRELEQREQAFLGQANQCSGAIAVLRELLAMDDSEASPDDAVERPRLAEDKG